MATSPAALPALAEAAPREGAAAIAWQLWASALAISCAPRLIFGSSNLATVAKQNTCCGRCTGAPDRVSFTAPLDDLPALQKRLARRVRELREAGGLRQEDLESFGLAWKTIQKLEYGETDPKLSTLLKLCRAFGLTLPELLGGDRRPVKGGPA